ncbi:MAG: hypothetical protein SFW67_21445 [Myxococcaceae bacterium]|nr:hypothetical protein [Myxococcaceae bacterium]
MGLVACSAGPATSFEIVRPLAPFDCRRVFQRTGSPGPEVLLRGERTRLRLDFIAHVECPQGVLPPDEVRVALSNADGLEIPAGVEVQVRNELVGFTGERYAVRVYVEFDVPQTSRVLVRVDAEPAIGSEQLFIEALPLSGRTWEIAGAGAIGHLDGPLGRVWLTSSSAVMPSGESLRQQAVAVTSTDVWLFDERRRVRWRPDAGFTEWPGSPPSSVSALGPSLAIVDPLGLALITEDGGRTPVLRGLSSGARAHFSTPEVITVADFGAVSRVAIANPSPVRPGSGPSLAMVSREGLWQLERGQVRFISPDGGAQFVAFPGTIANLPPLTDDTVPVFSIILEGGRFVAAVPVFDAAGAVGLELIELPRGVRATWSSSDWLFGADAENGLWRARRR